MSREKEENAQSVEEGVIKCAYEAPPWASLPTNSSFSLEVIKGGQSLEARELQKKTYFVFGRYPDSDFILEHPSISRHHCVIQLNGKSNEAFLFDLGSTHGTFLNKRKIPSLDFVAIKDGDVFKLGFSSRMYVFANTISHHIEQPKTKKTSMKKERHEVTWGIQEDAPQVPEVEEVNWREYAENNKLTEKQQKLSDKIKKLERKQERIEMECKRIHEKEAKFDELTGAQITTLLNNEQLIEQTKEEIEELEESLQTSIHEKLYPDQSRWLAHEKKKRASESDDDEFFDRTKKKKTKVDPHDSKTKALSTQDLVRERSDLKQRLVSLQEALADEANPIEKKEQPDTLDAFMEDLATKRQETEQHDRLAELQVIECRLEEISDLLEVTDPDKLFMRNKV